VYAAETCVDVALGVCILWLYGVVLVLTLTTEPLMNSALTPAGVFLLFGVFSTIAVVYVYFFLKESKHLSDKEKKALYSPPDLVDSTPNMTRFEARSKAIPTED
jgi:hypothetical protein